MCKTLKKNLTIKLGSWIQYPTTIDPRSSFYVHVTIDSFIFILFHTLPGLQEAVCTIFMMVFRLTCTGHKPITNRVRGV